MAEAVLQQTPDAFHVLRTPSKGPYFSLQLSKLPSRVTLPTLADDLRCMHLIADEQIPVSRRLTTSIYVEFQEKGIKHPVP